MLFKVEQVALTLFAVMYRALCELWTIRVHEDVT